MTQLSVPGSQGAVRTILPSTRRLRLVSAPDLESQERTVNREVFGDGFSGGGGTLVEGREIALADDARNQRIASLVHKGFLG